MNYVDARQSEPSHRAFLKEIRRYTFYEKKALNLLLVYKKRVEKQEAEALKYNVNLEKTNRTQGFQLAG